MLLAGCASMPEATGDPSLRARAEQAYTAGDAAQAIPLLEALARSSDARAEDWFRLGNAYADSSRLEDAADAYRHALRLDPRYHAAKHNLSLVYLQLGVTGLLEARRGLPPVDEAAAATMRYLACVMETFMGRPDPVTCGDPSATE